MNNICFLNDPAAGIGNRMNHNEGCIVYLFHNLAGFTQLQSRNHTKQNVLIGFRESSTSFVNRDAASQAVQERGAYLFTPGRYDSYAVVLLDAVQNKINRFRCCEICEDRIQRWVNTDEECRGQKNEDVQQENDITNSQQVTTLTYQ